MTYYADPQRDLPNAWEPKRIVFYARGLKIYGQIPYVLQRKLQAEFISNNAPLWGGGRIIGPTRERNYTIVSYRRKNGSPHSEATIKALLDWLYTDKGFEWGLAGAANFRDGLDGPNFFRQPPETVAPAAEDDRLDLIRLLTEGFNESTHD